MQSNSHPRPAFVGDHPALDFLNTLSTPAGDVAELIADGRGLLSWLEHAGLIGPEVVQRFQRNADPDGLDHVAQRAREFRERLRHFVRANMGRSLESPILAELAFLNDLLAEGEGHWQVVPGEKGGLSCVRKILFEKPEALLQPIVKAAADLVCNVDFRLVRRCEGHACTLMFVDMTKAHARRWCSMSVCGNRAKAAAHRARQKKAAS